MSWIAHWPEPVATEPLAMVIGWWWKPRDPELLGGWIVLSSVGSHARFIDITTTPLRPWERRAVRSSDAMHALYTALRDREAKRRGVDAATLDREAKLIEAGAPPPSETDEALRRAMALRDEDRHEDAIDLLTRLIDEDAGTDRDRARMAVLRASLVDEVGQFEEALTLYREARALALDQGLTEAAARLDPSIARLDGLAPFSPAARIGARGVTSVNRDNLAGARRHFERGLALVDREAEPWTAQELHIQLARVLDRTGDPAGARAHAAQALALGADADFTAEARALIERLDATGQPPR